MVLDVAAIPEDAWERIVEWCDLMTVASLARTCSHVRPACARRLADAHSALLDTFGSSSFSDTHGALSVVGASVSETNIRLLVDLVHVTRSLTSLRLDCVGLGFEGSRAIAIAIAGARGLTRLSLQHNQMTDRGVASVLYGVCESNARLHTLDLCGNLICSEGARSISKMVESSNLSFLNHLNLSHNSLRDEGLKELVGHMTRELLPHLNILIFFENELSSESMHLIDLIIDRVPNIRELHV